MSEWNYEEWAHAQAHENLKHRLASGDVLLAQANVLATVLLVGVGGAMGYATRLAERGPAVPEVWGALAAAAWLMWVAAVLVYLCVATRNTDVVGNEPSNLYFPDISPTELEVRAFELASVQRRITTTKSRNSDVAWWLDRCRYAALVTPVIFLLAVWVAGGHWG